MAQKTKKENPKKITKNLPWRVVHRKGLIITYYSVATLIILLCTGIILNSFVTRTEITESEEAIPFSIEYEDDGSLELGTEEVRQAGENGTKKIYTEDKKQLITGKTISSSVVNVEVIKEPTTKIVRRGTLRWQYMFCSDGSYRYYTDEQFQNSKVGFTHSSEDDCAKNHQGSMIALADTPPANNYYPSSRNSGLTETYVETLELIDRRERELRETAENTCRQEAEEARSAVSKQLEGIDVSELPYVVTPQYAYSSTYYNCMDRNGY